jgi:hypothetical protein
MMFSKGSHFACVLALYTILAHHDALAQATNYPSLANLTDSDSSTGMEVRCDPPVSGVLTCAITEIAIDKTPEAKTFDDAVQSLLSEALKSDSVACQLANAVTEVFQNPAADFRKDHEPIKRYYLALPAEAQADAKEKFESIAALCSSNTKQNAERVAKIVRDISSRTCRISTQKFQHRFSSQDGGLSWISNEGPSSECGTVTISKLSVENDGSNLWTYTTQTIVSNPDAKLFGLAECSTLDQRKHTFSWRGQDQYVKCDYVHFD